MPLPIEYTLVTRSADGHEGSVDLSESGWLNRADVREATQFSLQPHHEAEAFLPIVVVDLAPLPDGTIRELVYFSRVYGAIKTNASGNDEQTDLFRLYCIGWKALIGGRELKSVNWIYRGANGGSVVARACGAGNVPDPPYIQELIAHHLTKNLPHPVGV